MPLVAEIKAAVAAHYSISREDLEGPSRKRDYARPRQIAMALACEVTRHKQSRIGHFFDRDHSTVLFARRQVARLASSDDSVRQDLEDLRRELTEGAC